MTREKALEASRLLNDIDAYETLCVEVDEAFNNVTDIYDTAGKKEIYTKVMSMLEYQIERKKKELENL
jgi:hypothetical protein